MQTVYFSMFILSSQIIMNSNWLLVSFVWGNNQQPFEIIGSFIRTQNSQIEVREINCDFGIMFCDKMNGNDGFIILFQAKICNR